MHESLPSRERGLKLLTIVVYFKSREVAPLAGAWIEICLVAGILIDGRSLPSRERGLKFYNTFWLTDRARRSPRGSVD